MDLMLLTPIGALLALGFVVFNIVKVLKYPEGNAEVQSISAKIRQGANAFLRRQYSVVAIFFAVMLVILFVMAGFGFLTWFVPFAFVTGGFFSGLSGFIGMKLATAANGRTATAAKDSLNKGLRVAFSAGSVMGFTVVGLGLLDLSIWYYLLKYVFNRDIAEITASMLTFGMGASCMALFARVGGGIFTKAADVGADLVGKVEAGIPEDDPRNPAVIADNVGDNVGDVAGMGADLYESYVGSIVAASALGVAAFASVPEISGDQAVTIPMAMAGIGVLISIIGSFFVRTREDANQKSLLAALRRGTNFSAIAIAAVSFPLVWFMLGKDFMGIYGAILSGLIAGVGIAFITEYYTSDTYKPTKELADSTKTGTATLIIGGLSLGMVSTAVPLLIVCASILFSYFIAGGADNAAMGLYGIGISAVGMLSTLGLTLANDSYGPVADNAGGIAEMARLDPEVRQRTDALDSLGNTTAAVGKGFCIGAGALTALALIASYIDRIESLVRTPLEKAITDAIPELSGELSNIPLAELQSGAEQIGVEMTKLMSYSLDLNINNPLVLVGLLLGGMLPFLFTAMLMKSVGKAAQAIVVEVRRQFREITGLMEGKADADYARCVDLCTRSALKKMVLPTILAVAAPIAAGLLLGPSGVVGLLIGCTVSGFMMAVMTANSGGAWDNAKKYIEAGNHGGKGSDSHKAAVVGDTVGDPLKDTCGPSIDILLKLSSMVSIVFAALVLAFHVF
ncbi:MAG: sodium-translocating pyrophosphatase [Oscillospiraceae bacterium]|nr:sodium-translocating pyrophosphatase [Oscillospiraceae bacterium]